MKSFSLIIPGRWCWLLVSANFSQGDSTWPVAVRFLHSTSCRCTLARCFRCKLFARSFSTGWFSSCLFGTSHGLSRKFLKLLSWRSACTALGVVTFSFICQSFYSSSRLMRVKYAMKNCQVCTGVFFFFFQAPPRLHGSIATSKSVRKRCFSTFVCWNLCNYEQMILIGWYLILCFKLTNRRCNGVITIDTLLAGKIISARLN